MYQKMKLFKKITLWLLIVLYWYSQSVFSHLVMMDDHHESDSSTVQHAHEHNIAHEHIEQWWQWCDDVACETTCSSVEQSKIITSYRCIYIIIHDQRHHEIVFASEDVNPSETYIWLNIDNLWPPIPYESIAPRIWVTVRII